MRRELPLNKSLRLLYGGPVVLLTSATEERRNIATVSWHISLSQEPPLLGISLVPTSWSYRLIRESGEFCLNVPGLELLKKVHSCGISTGRDCDKFREVNIMSMASKMVRPPTLPECMGALECELRDDRKIGDRRFLVGEVVRADAEEEFFGDCWKKEAELIHHLGGSTYISNGETFEVQGNRITYPAYHPEGGKEVEWSFE